MLIGLLVSRVHHLVLLQRLQIQLSWLWRQVLLARVPQVSGESLSKLVLVHKRGWLQHTSSGTAQVHSALGSGVVQGTLQTKA